MPRSVAFSGKKKKSQLQQKRQKQQPLHRTTPLTLNVPKSDNDDEDAEIDDAGDAPKKTPKGQKGQVKPQNRHEKFKLLFQAESKEKLQEEKEIAQTRIVHFDEVNCRLDRQEFSPNFWIDYPRRPAWGKAKTPAEIDRVESAAFNAYLTQVHQQYDTLSLSFFEHNFETWRQLWRLIELVDVVVIVADSRHPVLHFPPSLYAHLKELNKRCILILSKIDLIRPEVYVAWKEYFGILYPELVVIGFTCFDRFAYRENKNIQQKRSRTVKFGNQFGSQLGPVELGEAIQTMYPAVDVSSWRTHLADVSQNVADGNDAAVDVIDNDDIKIGFVGHTNVGKSSIMNTLVGEKHFSMSSRPGHTKVLQTWSVASNVTLVDSPGLTFPSYYPKPLQILSGLFPIDQVRSPFTAIGFLAERVNLVQTFQLRHLSDEGAWTAWDICESFAQKKGFMVARKRYPDASRGANLMLRMAVHGQLVMSFTPPGFVINDWKDNEEVVKLKVMAQTDHQTRRVAAQTAKSQLFSKQSSSSSDDDDEESEEEDTEPPSFNRFALLDEDE